MLLSGQSRVATIPHVGLSPVVKIFSAILITTTEIAIHPSKILGKRSIVKMLNLSGRILEHLDIAKPVQS
jgi:hypothetical protein